MATQAQFQTGGRLQLRRVLQANAIFSAVTGIALVSSPRPLAALLGVAPVFLWPTGIMLIAYGGLLWFAATRAKNYRRLAWIATILDALWVVDSILVLITGWLPLTQTGWWIIVAQAVTVGVFAELQYLALRRA